MEYLAAKTMKARSTCSIQHEN